jgi:GNAT superfamily N-acetyltransferase
VNNLWQEGYISYIYAMVVDEKYRGKGYGTDLLKAAIDKSKEQGMKRVELDSGFPREKAHHFYEKFGFEKRAYLFSYIL